MAEELVDVIADLKEEEALRMVMSKLEAGESPTRIVELSRKAMDIVGKRFERCEYFISDLLMAGELVKKIMGIVGPKLREEAVEEEKRLGKVVIGTVEGDIHDIGKNIVVSLLDANGFDIYDLGVDVPPNQFVEKVKEARPEILGLSGLLTLAYNSMKKTVELIRKEGLRDRVKIIIGGAHIDERVCEYVGADAYADNASKGIEICKEWVKG